MTSPVRGYVPTSVGQLHYRQAARPGAPTLVLLHQSPLSSRNYDAALPLLAEHYNTVAVDTPGYGASDHPATAWSVAQYADTFWEALDALQIERPIIFGRATGAVFAVSMSIRQPHRVGRLILHGVPVYTDAEKTQRLAAFAPPFEFGPDGDHLEWIWRRAQGEYPWAPPELLTSFVQDYLAAGPDFASSYRAIWNYDLHQALAQLRISPLLLTGTADRLFHMHARAVRELPTARALVLPDATDFVAETDPIAFVAAVRDLLTAPVRDHPRSR